MLKIKDDINLNKLEKFGFKVHIFKNMNGTISESWFNNNGIEIKGDKVTRKQNYRQISNPHYLGHNKDTFDVLYDLIKAEMVEKVVKNNE